MPNKSNIFIGMKATMVKEASAELAEQYGEITGDYSPIHFSDEFAIEQGFSGRIMHGLFCLGMISKLLGTEVPGKGAIFVDESIKYLAPVYMGDVIETTVTITDIDERNIATVNLECINQNEVSVVKGVARLLKR